MNYKTFSDVLGDCMHKLVESMKILFEAVKEVWGKLKVFFEHVNLDKLLYIDKPIWATPKKMVMKSQVLNRKPMRVRARSTC